MARVREFDTDAAVAQAMELFWERGYEATSLHDLTGALGIGRGSLYAAFGSKDGLYQAALERYRQDLAGPMLRALSADSDVRAVLRGVLSGLVADAVADERRRGCMVVNATAERVPRDPATSRTVRDVLQAIEDALAEALGAARERGELPPGKDPRALAGFLVIWINGLRVAAKVDPDGDALMRSVEVAMTILD
jgi:TetR/AcrR family transcriptional regulator, transcriptional repressor for nem operon